MADTLRDASGVPAGLHVLIGLLAELASAPSPAHAADWERYRKVQGRRRSMLAVRLDSLASELAINDKYPSVAEEQFEQHCKRAIEVCRERLAEPLGYEPDLSEEDRGG